MESATISSVKSAAGKAFEVVFAVVSDSAYRLAEFDLYYLINANCRRSQNDRFYVPKYNDTKQSYNYFNARQVAKRACG